MRLRRSAVSVLLASPCQTDIWQWIRLLEYAGDESWSSARHRDARTVLIFLMKQLCSFVVSSASFEEFFR